MHVIIVLSSGWITTLVARQCLTEQVPFLAVDQATAKLAVENGLLLKQQLNDLGHAIGHIRHSKAKYMSLTGLVTAKDIHDSGMQAVLQAVQQPHSAVQSTFQQECT